MNAADPTQAAGGEAKPAAFVTGLMAGVVGIGVLGTASVARQRMLPAFHRACGARIVAIGSRERARADDLCQQYRATSLQGYRAVLEHPEVQAVYVPLPIALHADWVEQALLAGKHVLAEKPLTPSLESTTHLWELARSRRLVLMENFMFARHGQHRRIAALLAEGAIGPVRAFQARFGIPRPPAGDVRYVAELGGGALLDIGVQPLMVALHYLGTDLEVVGATLQYDRLHGVDTGGCILLATPQSATSVSITFGMEHYYSAECEWWGRDGHIQVDRPYAPPPDWTPSLMLLRAGRSPERIRVEPEDQGIATVEAFVAAIRNRQEGGDEHARDQQSEAARSMALARILQQVRTQVAQIKDSAPLSPSRPER